MSRINDILDKHNQLKSGNVAPVTVNEEQDQTQDSESNNELSPEVITKMSKLPILDIGIETGKALGMNKLLLSKPRRIANFNTFFSGLMTGLESQLDKSDSDNFDLDKLLKEINAGFKKAFNDYGGLDTP